MQVDFALFMLHMCSNLFIYLGAFISSRRRNSHEFSKYLRSRYEPITSKDQYL